MTYQEEMFAHLVHGGDPQVLLDAFMKDLNEAQKKADEQLAKEKKEAEANKTLKQKREAAVAALSDYFAFVLPMSKEVDMKAIVGEALDSLEETIKLMSGVTVRYNGKTYSVFDL